MIVESVLVAAMAFVPSFNLPGAKTRSRIVETEYEKQFEKRHGVEVVHKRNGKVYLRRARHQVR